MSPTPTTERIAGVLLAVALGIFFALFLAHYAAKGW
jgi:predicted outer membrane lipoprotein